MVFETLPSLTAQKTFSYVFSPEFKWEKMKGGGSEEAHPQPILHRDPFLNNNAKIWENEGKKRS